MRKRKRIAIIAASGHAPLDLAHTLSDQGNEPIIFAIENIATADFSGFKVITFPIGAVGQVISDMKKHHCDHLVFSGHLKRPPLHMMKPDFEGLKILAKVAVKGDDQALKIIKSAFVEAGIDVVDPADIMPEAYAHEGVMSGQMPDENVKLSIKTGIGLLEAITPFDVGQGCVIQDERVLAIEGAEGTDALLKRSADLIDQELGAPLFLKMMKTNQDPSLDPPGFGLDTIKHCVDANIKIIALEVGRVMMFKKSEVIAEAERKGITIIGIEASDV